ncbi:MAG TPA: dTDP-glucose 4,6-dehydratase, partial [Bryobacteraceae bacterium]|nr:dTDP-glucose 4,6-dehydratase [Bryobacteraceae bacterium]
KPDVIVNFAAESHVDRSILSPAPVFETNLRGTFTLLEAARTLQVPRYLQVSTDEVYGSIDAPHDADESYPLRASSPYSASKAGADLLALSYYVTYKMPVTVTRASNNYGPYQFPEKLIPLMIANAIDDKPLPIYGDGMQIRDWLYVEDHCRGVRAVLEHGRDGEIYNIGGNCSLPNLEVVRRILRATGKLESLIQYVTDRPGHDRRYALSSEKIMRETGWAPQVSFDDGLARTVDWYRDHAAWVARVRSGEYLSYYARNYENRQDELRTVADARSD